LARLTEPLRSPRDLWRIASYETRAYQKWIKLDRALNLVRLLQPHESDRIRFLAFSSSLDPTAHFEDSEVESLLFWKAAIVAPAGRTLIAIRFENCLKSLLGWFSGARLVVSDPRFENLAAFLFLCGVKAEAGRRILGETLGENNSISVLEQLRGATLEGTSDLGRFHQKLRASLLRPVNLNEFLAEGGRHAGRLPAQYNPTTLDQNEAEYWPRVWSLVASARAILLGLAVRALGDSLGKEGAVIAAVRNELLVEISAQSAKSRRSDLSSAIEQAIAAAFEGLDLQTSIGIGQSWPEAEKNANAERPMQVGEYVKILGVEIPGLGKPTDIVPASKFPPDELERLITENKVEATDEKPIEERYEKFGGK